MLHRYLKTCPRCAKEKQMIKLLCCLKTTETRPYCIFISDMFCFLAKPCFALFAIKLPLARVKKDGFKLHNYCLCSLLKYWSHIGWGPLIILKLSSNKLSKYRPWWFFLHRRTMQMIRGASREGGVCVSILHLQGLSTSIITLLGLSCWDNAVFYSA